MTEYQGPAPNDPTIGAHRYLDEHRHGAESYNFVRSSDGTVRGYRPPGDRERTNITRLGAGARDDILEGVLVVWMAREPGTQKTLIVGWYENATVFRKARDGGVDFHGERIHYTAEARVEDAVLLPPVARIFNVRSSRTDPGAGFGQKPTWYGAPSVDARVWDYVQARRGRRPRAKPAKPGRPPRNIDPELRRKVEKAAIAHATAYYRLPENGACDVCSVEAEAKGWDLEVAGADVSLLVEVKGLLKSEIICELTSNEYAKMMSGKNRKRYVVYVVNNALAEPPAVPTASIFGHVGGRLWRTEDGRELIIREMVAAILTCR
ncbi:MAG: protein NO VEIN domain-containing protein [Allosphingosinicella sp.]